MDGVTHDAAHPLLEALLSNPQGVFERVSSFELAELCRRASQRRLRPGDVLLTRGEPNDHMYVVLQGRLRVDLGNAEGDAIGEIQAVSAVGELSLLTRAAATATVTAIDEVDLLAIDGPVFSWLVNSSHAFAVNLLIAIAHRMQGSNLAAQQQLTQRRHFERVALHDALTGVPNRRWLDDSLPRLLRRHEFAGQPLCVAMLDADHFKRINDTLGHAAGDVVLVGLAETVTACLRPTDMIARVGGEEFVLLFPQTPIEGALRAADRVRAAIEAAVFSLDGGALPGVTVSLGVAERRPDETAPALIERADAALYGAKQAGRNRVHAAS